MSPALRTILAALRVAQPDPVPIPTLALLLWPDQPALRTRIGVQVQVYRLRVALRRAGVAAEVATVTREDGSTGYALAEAGQRATPVGTAPGLARVRPVDKIAPTTSGAVMRAAVFGAVAVVAAGCAGQAPEASGPMPAVAGVTCPPNGTVTLMSNGARPRYLGPDPADPAVCRIFSTDGVTRGRLANLFLLPMNDEPAARRALAGIFPLTVGREATFRGSLRAITPGEFTRIPADVTLRVEDERNVVIGGQSRSAFVVAVLTRNLVGNTRLTDRYTLDAATGAVLAFDAGEASGSIGGARSYRVTEIIPPGR